MAATKRAQRKSKTVAQPTKSIELTESVNARITWSLLKSFDKNIIAQCKLSLTLQNQDYSVKVRKVQENQHRNKKDHVLCRCLRLGSQHSGSFALFDGESAVISVILGGIQHTEITMATAQIVYHQADTFGDAYMKCIDTWEMSLSVKKDEG